MKQYGSVNGYCRNCREFFSLPEPGKKSEHWRWHKDARRDGGGYWECKHKDRKSSYKKIDLVVVCQKCSFQNVFLVNDSPDPDVVLGQLLDKECSACHEPLKDKQDVDELLIESLFTGEFCSEKHIY